MESQTLLKQLIGVCYDGHHGYQTAASHAGSMELKRFFAKLAAERKQFGEQLVEKLGDDPRSRGSVPGAVHRGWIDLKDKFGRLSQVDLLKECVRGEVSAVKHYEDVLAEQLPVEVTELVASQLSHIIESRDRIAELAKDGARE